MQISVTVEIHHVNHECSEGRSMYMYPFSWAPADEKNAAHEHDAGVHRRLTRNGCEVPNTPGRIGPARVCSDFVSHKICRSLLLFCVCA